MLAQFLSLALLSKKSSDQVQVPENKERPKVILANITIRATSRRLVWKLSIFQQERFLSGLYGLLAIHIVFCQGLIRHICELMNKISKTNHIMSLSITRVWFRHLSHRLETKTNNSKITTFSNPSYMIIKTN